MKRNNGFFLFLLFAFIIGIGLICVNFSKIKPANVNFFNLYNKQTVYASTNTENASVAGEDKLNFPEVFSELLFSKKNSQLNTKVYLGGQAIGMSFDAEGAVVIGINEFLSNEGLVSPALESNIEIGDVITEIDGKKITNSSVLTETLQIIGEKTILIKTKRGSALLEKEITSKFDIISKTYKLGLWVKDASSGIGTVSFVMQDGNFASLGHPVIDSKNGNIVKADGGGIYTCNILSIERGVRGKAGELRGVIDNQNKIGEIYQNNNFGVYGYFFKNQNQIFNKKKLIDVATVGEVVPGKATIFCTLDNSIPQEYEIEIIKASTQSNIQDKGLVLRVVDDKLLELTGGIVQGMSGSPIIQNGKLVGAVTHVFVNDPTKGYGIYAEWMLQTLNNITKNN